MKDGFIKVGTCTPELKVADVRFNVENIVEGIKYGVEKNVNLLVFPELSLTGYTCGDLFSQRCLLDAVNTGLVEVLNSTVSSDMIVIVGAPMVHKGKLYNCAFVIQKGEVLGVVPKTYLPNYNEFYERRNFEEALVEVVAVDLPVLDKVCIPFGTNLVFSCASLPEFAFGVEICEDLWSPIPPSSKLALAGATVICNLSASDELIGKAAYRRQLISNQSARLLSGYIYCDAGNGESTTDMVFAGHNIIAENGSILSESKLFEGGMQITELDVFKIDAERRKNTSFRINDTGYMFVKFDLVSRVTELTRKFKNKPFVPTDNMVRKQRCEDILMIQAQGLRKRLQHTNSKKVVLGISGGLDSCLALIVMAKAMDLLGRPRTDIIAISMPCFGTTGRTKNNAELVSNAFGVTFKEIPIGATVEQHFKDIGQPLDSYDVTYENGQARVRTLVLMDVANKEGGFVVGTGDLSELALGWCTYNGDHMSMYAVNASIPKTLVRFLVETEAYNNEESVREVLLDILGTPVSPELLPPDISGEIVQVTEDIVGPYELHDFFLYYTVRFGFNPAKLYRIAKEAFKGIFDNEIIFKWLKVFYKRFFQQQFKRSCMPDGPKVGSVGLSPRGDWRMPSDAQVVVWMEALDGVSEDI